MKTRILAQSQNHTHTTTPLLPLPSDNVHVYTPSSDSWETLDDAMPRERYRHAAAVVDSSLYVIGGRDLDDNVISQVDVLDTDTNTWSTLKVTKPR